jgi:hypothetical protein
MIASGYSQAEISEGAKRALTLICALLAASAGCIIKRGASATATSSAAVIGVSASRGAWADAGLVVNDERDGRL